MSAIALGACSSRAIARERPPAIAPAGQGWQLVLASPEANAIAAADAPELTRRNASLGVLSDEERFLRSNQPRPTLTRSRRLFLDDDADRPTFFLTPRSGFRGRGGYRQSPFRGY